MNRKLCPWSIQNSLGDGRDHELAMPPHFETTPQNVVFRGSGRVWPARFGKNRFSDRIFDFSEIFSMDVICSIMHPEGAWGVVNASRMRLGPVATTYGHFFENRKNRKKSDFFDFGELILVRILAKNGGQSEIPKLKNRFF